MATEDLRDGVEAFFGGGKPEFGGAEPAATGRPYPELQSHRARIPPGKDRMKKVVALARPRPRLSRARRLRRQQRQQRHDQRPTTGSEPRKAPAAKKRRRQRRRAKRAARSSRSKPPSGANSPTPPKKRPPRPAGHDRIRKPAGTAHDVAIEDSSGKELGETELVAEGSTRRPGRPEAGHLHVLLHRPRPPRSGHGRDADRQVAGRCDRIQRRRLRGAPSSGDSG